MVLETENSVFFYNFKQILFLLPNGEFFDFDDTIVIGHDVFGLDWDVT